MGQTPLLRILTDTEYICPLIGPLNHAHHGTDSAALLPGPVFFLLWGGRKVDFELIEWRSNVSTQSLPLRPFSIVPSPKIVPLTRLLLS